MEGRCITIGRSNHIPRIEVNMGTTIPPQAGPPPKKKTSPLVWILVGVAGFLVLIGILLLAAGLFVVGKVKQAGLDPELMRDNPALAVSKLIAATNPDVEVLSVKDGMVTLKEKKTGKTVTISMDKLSEGIISFEGNEGESMTFDTSGGEGSGVVRFKSSEGEMEFGGSLGEMPDWVPVYESGNTRTVTSAQQAGRGQGSYVLMTSDPPAKVLSFYTAELKDAGLRPEASGETIRAQDAASNRSVQVLIVRMQDDTSITVSYGPIK